MLDLRSGMSIISQKMVVMDSVPVGLPCGAQSKIEFSLPSHVRQPATIGLSEFVVRETPYVYRLPLLKPRALHTTFAAPSFSPARKIEIIGDQTFKSTVQ